LNGSPRALLKIELMLVDQNLMLVDQNLMLVDQNLMLRLDALEYKVNIIFDELRIIKIIR
jgi:hypothetical protein